jgi:anti-sigma factor RsiW
VTVADSKLPPDDDPTPDARTEELVAYLDGELDPKAAEAMATKLSLDTNLRAEADALQRAWDILDVLPRRQPSAAFTTRTVSQVIPASSSGTQLLPPGSAVQPMPAALPSRAGAGFWLGSFALVLLAGVGGYFAHRALVPPPKGDPPLEDVTLMKNLRLYRHVDDIEYLKKLDSPELFADDGD